MLHLCYNVGTIKLVPKIKHNNDNFEKYNYFKKNMTKGLYGKDR